MEKSLRKERVTLWKGMQWSERKREEKNPCILSRGTERSCGEMKELQKKQRKNIESREVEND